uniref:E2F/DP family winged-helix DNA-binding domain-containing protein n=1 Tax=Amorphochlora amoebiformis TaxID=1561963 RepID=A0A7S0DAH8_9EUKA
MGGMKLSDQADQSSIRPISAFTNKLADQSFFRPISAFENKAAEDLRTQTRRGCSSCPPVSLPNFARPHSRCSRDTSLTLPRSPTVDGKGEFSFQSSLPARSASVITIAAGDESDDEIRGIRDSQSTQVSSIPETEIMEERKIPKEISPPVEFRYSPAVLTFEKIVKPQPKPFELDLGKSSRPTFTRQRPSMLIQQPRPLRPQSQFIKPQPMKAVRPVPEKPQCPPKAQKGLKYLSNKICETLARMGSATQENIIQKLYESFVSDTEGGPEQSEKSIRRRIYDTLNVLMALGMVSKERQQIKWIGRTDSVSASDVRDLKKQLTEKKKILSQKRRLMEEEEHLLARTKTLIDRNKNDRAKRRRFSCPERNRLHFPFLLVEGKDYDQLSCLTSSGGRKWEIEGSVLKIYNDFDVLKLMAGTKP